MRQNSPVPVFGLLLWLIFASTGRAQGGGTWQTPAPMPLSRQELATGTLNGKLYVLGGYDASRASTANVQVYNPTTDTWTSAHPLPYPINHNAAAVAGGASWARSLIGRWKAQVNAKVPRLALFCLCPSASRYALDH